jgi:hypothetical protein
MCHFISPNIFLAMPIYLTVSATGDIVFTVLGLVNEMNEGWEKDLPVAIFTSVTKLPFSPPRDGGRKKNYDKSFIQYFAARFSEDHGGGGGRRVAAGVDCRAVRRASGRPTASVRVA